MAPIKIIVVGGGLVGALAGILFAQRFPNSIVEIYESRDDPRSSKINSGRSINLAISVRGLSALKLADLDQKILVQAVPMKGRMIHKDGKLTFQEYGLFGECINSVDRKQLNVELIKLAATLPNVSMFFNHDLVKIIPTSTHTSLTFLTRHSIVSTTGDFIIGADGVNSPTRAFLQSHAPISLVQECIPHSYMELSIPPIYKSKDTPEYAMVPNALHIWPRKTFMLIALPNRDKSFTATLFMPTEKFDGLTAPADVLSFFKSTFPDFVELLGETELLRQFKGKIGKLGWIKSSPHNFGNVVLVGDAAHAMVPFYGQGMNCGFEDIVVLLERFSDAGYSDSTKTLNDEKLKSDLPNILQSYSDTRVKDTHAIVDLALHNYIEMRDSVATVQYVIGKTVMKFAARISAFFIGNSTRLEKWKIVPVYSMVSFSRERYSRVVKVMKWRDRMGQIAGWGAGVLVFGIGIGVGLRFVEIHKAREAGREAAIQAARNSEVKGIFDILRQFTKNFE